MESLFIQNMYKSICFQNMYKSQFRKIDPYDWFCGPGSRFVQFLIISS